MPQADMTKTVRYGIESVRGTSVTATHILDIESAELEHNVPSVRSSNLTGGVFAPMGRAVEDGDHWIVNGQKVWNTMAEMSVPWSPGTLSKARVTARLIPRGAT